MRATGDGYLFISEDGSLYGIGNRSLLGLNDGNASYVEKMTLVNNDKFSSFYDEKVLNGFDGRMPSMAIKNGTTFMTGNSGLMFGNEILEKNWKKVASNVSFFNGYGNCYIDTSNNLYMSGDSRYMGLGERSSVYENIPNYIKITDNSISGNVEKCWQKGSITYVLLTNHELWATGMYINNANKTQYPGWNDQNNKTVFVKVLDNVDFFDIQCSSSGDDSTKIARLTSGEFYYWGDIIDGATGDGKSGNVKIDKPALLDLSYLSGAEKNISCFMFPFGHSINSFFLTKDGLWYGSGKTDLWVGGKSTDLIYKNLGLPYVNNEIATKMVSCVANSILFLTDNGKVLGYGPSTLLGKGSFSTDLEQIQTISGLSSYNICDLTAGDGYYIAITTDGKVLGTGSNQSGVLGRWIGIDRTSPDNRYKTANQWVECPELEL